MKQHSPTKQTENSCSRNRRLSRRPAAIRNPDRKLSSLFQLLVVLLIVCNPVCCRFKHKAKKEVKVDTQPKWYFVEKDYIFRHLTAADITRVKNQPSWEETANLLDQTRERRLSEPLEQRKDGYQAVLGTKRLNELEMMLRITFKQKSDWLYQHPTGITMKLQMPHNLLSSPAENLHANFYTNTTAGKNITTEGNVSSCYKIFLIDFFPFFNVTSERLTSSFKKASFGYRSKKHLVQRREQNEKEALFEFPLTDFKIYYTAENYSYLLIFEQENHTKFLKEPFAEWSQLDEPTLYLEVIVNNILRIFLTWWLFFKSTSFSLIDRLKKHYGAQCFFFFSAMSNVIMMKIAEGTWLVIAVDCGVMAISFLSLAHSCYLFRLLDDSESISLSKLHSKRRVYLGTVIGVILTLIMWFFTLFLNFYSITFRATVYLFYAFWDILCDWNPAERALSLFGREVVMHCLMAYALTEPYFKILKISMMRNFVINEWDCFGFGRKMNLISIPVFIFLVLLRFAISRVWQKKKIGKVNANVIVHKCNGMDKEDSVEVMITQRDGMSSEDSTNWDQTDSTKKNDGFDSVVDRMMLNSERASLLMANTVIQKRKSGIIKNSKGINKKEKIHDHHQRRLIEDVDEPHRIDSSLNTILSTTSSDQDVGLTKEHDMNVEMKIMEDSSQLDSFYIPKWKGFRTSGLYSIVSTKNNGLVLKHTVVGPGDCGVNTLTNKTKNRTDFYKKKTGWMINLTPFLPKYLEDKTIQENIKNVIPAIVNKISIPHARFQERNYLCLLRIESRRGFMRLVNTRTKRVVLNSKSVEYCSGPDQERLRRCIQRQTSKYSHYTQFTSSMVLSPEPNEGRIRLFALANNKQEKTPEDQGPDNKDGLDCLSMSFRKGVVRSKDALREYPLLLRRLKKVSEEKLKITKNIDFQKYMFIYKRDEKSDKPILENYLDYEMEVSDCCRYVFLRKNPETINSLNESNQEKIDQELLVLVRYNYYRTSFYNRYEQQEIAEEVKNIFRAEYQRRGLEMPTYKTVKKSVTKYTLYENFIIGRSLTRMKKRMFGSEKVLKFGPWEKKLAYMLTSNRLAVIDFMRGKFVRMIDIQVNPPLTRCGLACSQALLGPGLAATPEVGTTQLFDVVEKTLKVYTIHKSPRLKTNNNKQIENVLESEERLILKSENAKDLSLEKANNSVKDEKNLKNSILTQGLSGRTLLMSRQRWKEYELVSSINLKNF